MVKKMRAVCSLTLLFSLCIAALRVDEPARAVNTKNNAESEEKDSTAEMKKWKNQLGAYVYENNWHERFYTAYGVENAGAVPEGTKVITNKTDGMPLVPEHAASWYGKIILPESLEEIAEGATFSGFHNLREITIPKNVKIINPEAFLNCYNLQKMVNLSSQKVVLPVCGADIVDEEYVLGYDWYVNGKPVKEAGPGETAVAKPKTFSIKYKLKGGKFTTKKVTKYTYGAVTKLPKAKKKGYVFMGWQMDTTIVSGAEAVFEIDSKRLCYAGDKTFTAQWKKIDVKRKGKKLTIKALNKPKESAYDYDVACLYSENKDMKGAKLISLGRDNYVKMKYKKNVGKLKAGKCLIKHNKKSGLLSCTVSGLKKNKRYYIQFRRYLYDDENDEITTTYTYPFKEMVK